MFRASLLGLGLISSSAFAHHAACVSDPYDGFMTCGAHSGRITFELQHYGDVTETTRQLILCNDQGAKVSKMGFQWVESDDASSHFPMQEIRYRQISENCLLLGGLDFTPPDAFKDLDENAWKLDIFVDGVDVPTSIYVEALSSK